MGTNVFSLEPFARKVWRQADKEIPVGSHTSPLDLREKNGLLYL